jgi:hypothetical protein
MPTIERPITERPTVENRAEAMLEHLVRHALEVMCFAEIERLPSLAPIVHPVEARIGNLHIAAAPATARALTAAFLGVEPWHPSLESQTQDVVREITRVVCGRLVTSLDSIEPRQTIRQAFRLSAGTLSVTLQLS